MGLGVVLWLLHLSQTANGVEPNHTANVTILVPVGATLHINNQSTRQMSAVRKFITPTLVPGKRYRYNFEATFLWYGEEITKKKSIIVQAGQNLRVDLMEGETVLPSAPKLDPKPESVVPKPDAVKQKPIMPQPKPEIKKHSAQPYKPMPSAVKPAIEKSEINKNDSPLPMPQPKPTLPELPIPSEPTRPQAPPPREVAPRKGK